MKVSLATFTWTTASLDFIGNLRCKGNFQSDPVRMEAIYHTSA